MTSENILVKSQRCQFGKSLFAIAMIVAFICVLLCSIPFIRYVSEYQSCDTNVYVNGIVIREYEKCHNLDRAQKCNEHRRGSAMQCAWWDGEETYIVAAIITASFWLICLLIHWGMKEVEITVTSKRVYGRAAFGRRIDLPIDSVSAVGLSWPKGISIATSSGRISFSMIENRDEIHKCISNLLMDRQNKQPNTTTIRQELPQSNADEIRKYKQLLDDGVITQEEFDAKKKQLLGL